MTKFDFLMSLSERLLYLPKDEALERLNFYNEMIEDRMEEGLSEEEAVAAVGAVDDVTSQILSETSSQNDAKTERICKHRFKWWEILLLALGSPVWLSLLISAFSVALSLYISLWAVLISLWAVFGSLIGCAFCGIAAGSGFACCGYVTSGFAMIGAGIVCAGLSIFMFYGCKAATKGTLLLAKVCAKVINKCFVKKEEA